MKKLPLILSALLLISSLAACGGEEKKPDDSQTPTDSGTSGDTEEAGEKSFIDKLIEDRSKLSDGLPETDLGKKPFRVGYFGGSLFPMEWNPDADSSDILISEAIYKRNLSIEERFNTEFTFCPIDSKNPTQAVTGLVMSGDPGFDMMVSPQFSQLVVSGTFLPLNELDYLDFTKPWWIAETAEALSYGDNVYCAFGFATPVSIIGNASIMYFNKDIAADMDLENLYDVVREGRWTLGYIQELNKIVAQDLDNDGIYKPGSDQLTIFIPMEGRLNSVSRFFNYQTIAHDSSGIPVMNIDSQRFADIFEGVKEFINTPGISCIGNYEEHFQKGGILLGIEAINAAALAGYRNAGFDFGLLPPFKYDEEQEFYYTDILGGPQAIPVTNTDADTTALLMEAVNAESYKTTVPTYYETVLKDKCSRDVDSAEMLDLTLSHICFESGYLFCPKAVGFLMAYCSSDQGFGSYFEEVRKPREKELQENIEQLDNLG